jgi:folate-dependent phosphoribosylglycinamide formyltransferase PurN
LPLSLASSEDDAYLARRDDWLWRAGLFWYKTPKLYKKELNKQKQRLTLYKEKISGARADWPQLAKLMAALKTKFLGAYPKRIVNGHPNSEIDQLLPWAYRRRDLKSVA